MAGHSGWWDSCRCRRPGSLVIFGFLAIGDCECATTSGLVEVTRITVTTQDATTFRVGETVDLVAQALNREGNSVTANFTWSTSDAGVATVQTLVPSRNARVTAVGTGGVSITATETGTGYPGSIALTTLPPALSAIRVLPVDPTIATGSTQQVMAEAIRTSDGSVTAVPFTWSTAAPLVATVTPDPSSSSRATVVGVSPGTARITAVEASQPNVTGTTTVTVAGPIARSFITGTMFGADNVTPLPGMVVRAGGRATTDADGRFTIELTTGGVFELYAQGVCDPTRPCSTELSFNATEIENVAVAAGETKVFDPMAQRGYHLRITGGAVNRAVLPGSTFPLQLGYQAWNRAGAPGAVPRLAPGIEGTPGPTHPIGVAGVYPGVAGTTNLTLTAPTMPGDYGVFVWLARTSDPLDAENRYRIGFENPTTRAEEFIRIFTLKVCATAPNCP